MRRRYVCFKIRKKSSKKLGIVWRIASYLVSKKKKQKVENLEVNDLHLAKLHVVRVAQQQMLLVVLIYEDDVVEGSTRGDVWSSATSF